VPWYWHFTTAFLEASKVRRLLFDLRANQRDETRARLRDRWGGKGAEARFALEGKVSPLMSVSRFSPSLSALSFLFSQPLFVGFSLF
jgi:hypothetical protein